MDSKDALYGVCKLSVASVWKNAIPDSCIITQALFGESVRILRIKNKNWVRVECCWDGQLGWMDPKQLYLLNEKAYSRFQRTRDYNLELIYGIHSENKSIPISIGAELHRFDGINVKMPFGKFQFSGQVFSPDTAQVNEALLIKLAQKFMNAPQLKGGRSVLGIDADGFVQLIYKFVGIQLPRTAFEQAAFGEDIGFFNHARVGDIAFFAKSNNQIHHAGIVTGPGSIIHVHGRVKTDQLDQQGIFDLETRRYTYKLRTIRRVVELDRESAESDETLEHIKYSNQ